MNSEIYIRSKHYKLYGAAGSLLTCVILFLFLWFVALSVATAEAPSEEQGLLIGFGDSEEGGGSNPEPSGKIDIAATTISKPIEVRKTTQQDLMTESGTENAINDVKKKNVVDKAFNQTATNDKALKDKSKREQEAINTANNTMSGLFGHSTTNGSGTSTGDNMQGNPLGKGVSNGNSYSITGRRLMGTLATPSYTNDVEGKVTVNIRVDENGNVMNASIGSPTNISDADTRNAAISAAKNTRFTSGSGTATGSITYNFKLR